MKNGMFSKSAIVGLFCLLAASTAQAVSLDLNGNDDTARGTVAAYVTPEVVVDGSVLYYDESDKSDEPPESGALAHLGANYVYKNLHFGLRGTYTSIDKYDLLSFGVGLNARFGLMERLFFDLGGYYAPEFTSAMDSDGYAEVNARLSFNIIDPIDLYVGSRYIDVVIEDADDRLKLDNNAYLGLKIYY
ncbi:MAG: YfaZ family outer membrane protein [Campylobacterales bacterium]